MNNSITIIGHLGQNPTEKSFPSGKKKADHFIVKPVIILGGYHLCGKKQNSNSATGKIKLKATA